VWCLFELRSVIANVQQSFESLFCERVRIFIAERARVRLNPPRIDCHIVLGLKNSHHMQNVINNTLHPWVADAVSTAYPFNDRFRVRNDVQLRNVIAMQQVVEASVITLGWLSTIVSTVSQAAKVLKQVLESVTDGVGLTEVNTAASGEVVGERCRVYVCVEVALAEYNTEILSA
jgi:hypothetical protein